MQINLIVHLWPVHFLYEYYASIKTSKAKTWKKANCPSTDEYRRYSVCVCVCVCVCTHQVEYYSALKKNEPDEPSAICSNMDGPRDYRTKWSKPEREKWISYDIIYM